VRAVRGPDAERTPDLLDPAATQDDYPTRQVCAKVGHQLLALPHESVTYKLQQLNCKSSLQPDDSFRAITQPVVAGGQQLSVIMKSGEPYISVIVGVIFPAMDRAKPHDVVLLVHPGDTAL